MPEPAPKAAMMLAEGDVLALDDVVAAVVVVMG
jgi:hypothetical protein